MLSFLPALTAFLVLLISTTILYQQSAQLSSPRRVVLWASIFVAGVVILISIDAEPWAYLLFGAGGTLYFATTGLHSKYHKVSPKGSRGGTFNGKNRRERRRER